jgi:hypothetical protein
MREAAEELGLTSIPADRWSTTEYGASRIKCAWMREWDAGIFKEACTFWVSLDARSHEI